MRGSNSSTIDGAGRRSYLGGASDANAARTVFRDTFNTRPIILIDNPSARCNLRISAQSSTDNTPSSSRPDQGQETRKGVKIRAATRGQFSGGADMFMAAGGLAIWFDVVASVAWSSWDR